MLAAGLVLLMFEGVAVWLEPRLPAVQTWSNPFAQAKFEQISTMSAGRDPDLLIVGSSIANAGLDARELGARLGVEAYNAGIPSSTMEVWAAFAEDAVFSRSCPAVTLIAIGIRDANANLPGIERALARYQQSEGRRRSLGLAGGPFDDPFGWLEHQAGEVSAFVRLRPLLREPGLVISWLQEGRAPGWSDPSRDLDSHGRYLRFGRRAFDPVGQLAEVEHVFADFKVGGLQEDGLRRLVDSARASGGATVIIDMPAMTTILVDGIPAGEERLAEYRTWLRDFSTEKRVPVLDLTFLDDREELFADLYHLNDDGVAAVTDRIADWLRENQDAVPLAMGTKSTC